MAKKKVYVIEFLTKKGAPYKRRGMSDWHYDSAKTAQARVDSWKDMGVSARVVTFEEVKAE